MKEGQQTERERILHFILEATEAENLRLRRFVDGLRAASSSVPAPRRNGRRSLSGRTVRSGR